MAPKGKASSGPALKQGTLSFASAKRGLTATGKANTLKASPSAISVKPPSTEKKKQGLRTTSIGSTISVNTSTTDANSDDEVVLVTPKADLRSTKRRKTEEGQVKRSSGVAKLKSPTNESDTSSDGELTEAGDLKVLEKNPRIQRLHNRAKTRMGDVPPVHAKDQTKIDHILRVFDTSYEYGPCVGMTRLQRWERAHALGLNPPPEVREILTTKQGLSEDKYKQCVLYGEL